MRRRPDKDRDGKNAPSACPQAPQSGNGAQPTSVLSQLGQNKLLETPNIGSTVQAETWALTLAAATPKPELKTNPESYGGQDVSSRYRNSAQHTERYRGDSCNSVGKAYIKRHWACVHKSQFPLLGSLCHYSCPSSRPASVAGIFPPGLADGEARRIKSSAYSLHHHEGHRAAAGHLESSLRGRIRWWQCHLQGTFPPRS